MATWRFRNDNCFYKHFSQKIHAQTFRNSKIVFTNHIKSIYWHSITLFFTKYQNLAYHILIIRIIFPKHMHKHTKKWPLLAGVKCKFFDIFKVSRGYTLLAPCCLTLKFRKEVNTHSEYDLNTPKERQSSVVRVLSRVSFPEGSTTPVRFSSDRFSDKFVNSDSVFFIVAMV